MDLNITNTHMDGKLNSNSIFLPPKEASRLLGVPGTTLRLWAETGDINFIRKGGPGTKRYYNIQEFIQRRQSPSPCTQSSRTECIVYARVSTRGQLDDLDRQKRYLLDRYPEHTIITDIASGLNFKRPGLQSILDKALQGTLKEVVVAHQDRLCRFGFELVRYILEEKCNVQLVVLNNQKSTPQEELVADLLSIITVFAARANGLRKYKTEIKKDFNIPDTGPKEVVS